MLPCRYSFVLVFNRTSVVIEPSSFLKNSKLHFFMAGQSSSASVMTTGLPLFESKAYK